MRFRREAIVRYSSSLLFVLFVAAAPARATTWVVQPDSTGDFPTIQAAVDSAAAGDVIELAPGVFTGSGNRDVDLHGKAITIRGQGTDPAAITIDCQGAWGDPHRGFLVRSGEGQDTILEGFTVRNGDMRSADEIGGGLYVQRASPVLRHLHVVECRAVAGGGLHLEPRTFEVPATAVVENCVFRSNVAQGGGVSTEGGPGNGGGAVVWAAGTALFTGCVFEANTAENVSGGAHVSGGADATFTDCRFAANAAAGAAALDATVSGPNTARIERCVFEDNQSASGPAGTSRVLSVVDSAFRRNSGGGPVIYRTGTILGCTFLDNTVTGTEDGAVVTVFSLPGLVERCTFAGSHASAAILARSPVTIRKTIVAFNTTLEPVACAFPGRATLECSDVFGNAGGDWVGCIAGQETSAGNLHADPLFCDRAAGDVGLRGNSPCAPAQAGSCGLVGAVPVQCEPTLVTARTWGAVKAMFR